MRESIYASFADADSATKVIGALLDHGVRAEDTSILIKTFPQADASGNRPTDAHDVRVRAEGISVTTPEDAATGAVRGAGVGLGIGALAALAAVTIPGFGLALGGGALATAIAGWVGAGAAGAMAGAVAGYLKDQGVSPEIVDTFSRSVEDGGALVSVSVPSGDVPTSTILSLFAKYGGTVGTTNRARSERPYAATPPHVPMS